MVIPKLAAYRPLDPAPFDVMPLHAISPNPVLLRKGHVNMILAIWDPLPLLRRQPLYYPTFPLHLPLGLPLRIGNKSK